MNSRQYYLILISFTCLIAQASDLSSMHISDPFSQNTLSAALKEKLQALQLKNAILQEAIKNKTLRTQLNPPQILPIAQPLPTLPKISTQSLSNKKQRHTPTGPQLLAILSNLKSSSAIIKLNGKLSTIRSGTKLNGKMLKVISPTQIRIGQQYFFLEKN